MTCEEARERLPWLWNGTLAEEERALLDRHLEGCAACWREWEETQWLAEAVASEKEDVSSTFFTPGRAAIAAGFAALFLGAGWWNASRKALPPSPLAMANITVSDVLPGEWKLRGEAGKAAQIIPSGEPALLILAVPMVEGFRPGRLELLRAGQTLWSEPNPRRHAEGDFTVLLPAGLQAGDYDLQLYGASGSEPAAVYRITARPR